MYEAKLDKRFMNLEALLPLIVDEAFMPHMKAVDVPCHFLYGGLTCYQRLQSDRPKCSGVLVEVSRTTKYDHIIPISWIMDLNFISVDSPECPLSDEV